MEKLVLVIDDDELIRGMVRWALEAAGYAVLEAENGLHALQVISSCQRQPDLILLDLRMPGMDGWAFARAYRGVAVPLAPVVVMTAETGAKAQAEEINATAYLEKPFQIADLYATVEQFVA